jgi:uncharacterized protein YjbJ (UPF0337 family)
MIIVLGHTTTLLGACQRATGHAIGNKSMAQAGLERYFTGKGQVAAGEAQDIIKACIARLQTR